MVQSAGTLFFNVSTYQAMHTAVTSSEYNKLVWRPDWRGSICFLVSGAIAYHASPRHGWRPTRAGRGWWQPAINLFRCGAHFIVCAELAGVERGAIDVRAEARRVVLRGTRAAPEPACEEPPALQVLTFEIDHGPFERTIDLPAEIDPRGVAGWKARAP